METVRLRLLFENRHILTKTQKSEGLNRSWLLLKPEIETISDLTSYLTHTFHLEHSCPNGILLAMDDFVLPSSESTRIFRDKDIVRVTRKGDVMRIGDVGFLEDSESAEEQPVLPGVKLLALEEFERESGGYQSEPEEDENEQDVPETALPPKTTSNGNETSKKRKSSAKLHSSKRKRVRSPCPEQSPKVLNEGVENDDEADNEDLHQKGAISNKSSHKKDKSSKTSTTKKRESTTDVDHREEKSVKKKRVRSTSAEKSHTSEGTENDDHAKDQDFNHKEAFSRKSLHKKDRSSKKNAKFIKESITHVDNLVETSVEHPSENRKKRVRSTSPEKFPKHTTKGAQNDDHAKNQDCNHRQGLSCKSVNKKDRSCKINTNFLKESIIGVGNGDEGRVEHMHSEDRNEEIPEKRKEDVEGFAVPEGKGPSRSARRKKAKRQWLRELINSQKEESNMHEKLMPDKSQKLQEPHENTDPEAEIVPIVVKPGHIRFEPISEEVVNRETQDPKGTFQWNGTTSKKKGQKWGMEKTSVSRSHGYGDICKEAFEMPTVEEGELVHDSVDFEKLKPLSCLPKVGDVVAYRLVELSSSWCPELSPFRVGKISWFDSASNKIMLVVVPGYPVTSEKKGEDGDIDEQLASSLYNEDGSLEIDFPSLVDVRIFSSGNSGSTSTVADGDRTVPASNKEAGSGVRSSGNSEETTVSPDGSKKASASDEVRPGVASTANHGKETTVATNGSKKASASDEARPGVATNANHGKETTVATDGSKKASASDEARSGAASNGETHALAIGNGKAPDVWEEISQALSEKKSQLLQVDSWSKKETSGRGKWSFKSMRSTAIGPTMALLRGGGGSKK